MMFDWVGLRSPGIYKSQVGLKFKLVRIRSEAIGNLRKQEMRCLSSFAIFFAMVVGTAISKPLWSTLVGANYLYSTPGIGQQQYFAAYQNTPSPYYVYNIYSNTESVPNTLHVNSKPEISHIPAYSFYYETPIYDIRIPLNPVYPVLTPSHPGIPPILPPTSTEQSSDEENYDGIEKLDTKVDPDTETKNPENTDDDSITVEAI